MTDEQLGREWCRRNGLAPQHRPDQDSSRQYRWVYDDGPAHGLPHDVWRHLECGPSRYRTEADAYADVGAALRDLVGESERLRAIAEEARAILGVEPLAEEHDTEWIVVPMPLNADGQGPETDPALVARTEWHVWTHDCIAVAVARSEAVAKHIVDLHNREASR